MSIENGPLLTIAIPTYNRSWYLERCLFQIINQMANYSSRVELIISDNCSTDDTETVVNSFISDGHKINYIKNMTNIGADANFRQCFEHANGKYFLLFSDDDLLLDDSLRKLIELIEGEDFGVIHLSSYFFKSDYQKERPQRKKKGVIIFNDLDSFIQKVDVWFTFISGNVINKSIVNTNLDLNDFADTNLPHLSWTFSSLFNSQKNVYYDEYFVAGQGDNSGGYRFCEVFGKNMNAIFRTFEKKYGVDFKYFDIINRKTLKKHLSKFILAARTDFGRHDEEDFLHMLHPIFKSYLSYWIFVYPAIKWPLPLAKLWCKISRFFAKLLQLL